MLWVVGIGNPWDGVTLHGPFGSAEEAGDYAERNFSDQDWWTVRVHPV